MATGTSKNAHQKRNMALEMLMSSCVIAGSSASNSSKIFSNSGTILIMMNVRMRMATTMTTIG